MKSIYLPSTVTSYESGIIFGINKFSKCSFHIINVIFLIKKLLEMYHLRVTFGNDVKWRKLFA